MSAPPGSQLCWWCCQPFEGPGVGMPYEFANGTFKTMGTFCDWPCVKAFNMHRGKHNEGAVSDLITLMRKRSHGKITPLKSAPSRFVLKAFGGTLTIEEFRQTPETQVTFPDEIRSMPLIEARMPPKAPDPDGPLVLARPKPLKRETTGIHQLVRRTLAA